MMKLPTLRCFPRVTYDMPYHMLVNLQGRDAGDGTSHQTSVASRFLSSLASHRTNRSRPPFIIPYSSLPCTAFHDCPSGVLSRLPLPTLLSYAAAKVCGRVLPEFLST